VSVVFFGVDGLVGFDGWMVWYCTGMLLAGWLEMIPSGSGKPKKAGFIRFILQCLRKEFGSAAKGMMWSQS
jgi:hypothetical protein